VTGSAHRHRVSRRAVLRGLGASLTLPFLPSLAWAGDPQAASAPPRRFACLLFANGVKEGDWGVETDATGRITGVRRSLRPLAEWTDQLFLPRRLHLFDDTFGVHLPFYTNFLTGREVPRGSLPRLGISLDQQMAQTVGSSTPLGSLVLGTEVAGIGLDQGKPAIYKGTVSWSSPTTPITPETIPRAAFDRLFDTSDRALDRSVLDRVQRQARDLRRDLDRTDQRKLDEYLESVREVERRVEIATTERPEDAWQPTLDEPDVPRPQEGRPPTVPEHVRLMLDILVLALQMDRTRVATFLFQNDLTGMTFDFIEGVGKTGLHTMSHHRQRAETLRQYQLVNQWHSAQFAYVLDKMAAVDEGDGTTLLDNTMLLFGSTMMDGDSHDANDLPLIVAGGRSAGIRGGRAVRYDRLEDRRLCNLHLDLLNRMGHDAESFGNSHYRLPEVGG